MEASIKKICLNKTDELIVSQIFKLIKTLKFGSIEIVIHDSKIIQVNKVEKMRFDK